MIQIDATQPVNLRHPLNRGLIAWWLAGVHGRTGGNKWIDLVQAHRGTLGSTMDPKTDWVRTERRGTHEALDFDETVGEYVVVPKAVSIRGAAAASLSVWYRPTAIPTTNASLYYESTSSAASTRWSIFHLATTGYTQVSMRDTNTGTAFNALESVALTNGVWQHLLATVDAATDRLVLYRNGVERAVNTTAKGGFTTDIPAADITIGSFGTSQRINGRIDDVRVWCRALSAAEVKTYYERSLQGYPGLLNRIEPIIGMPPPIAPVGRVHINLSGNLQSLFGGMQN